MDLVPYAIPFFLLAIAVELGWNGFRKAGYYRSNDAINSLSLGVLSTASKLVLVDIAGRVYGWVQQDLAVVRWGLDGWLSLVVAFIAYDFCYYWFHRISHERRIFWAAHVAHHQSEEYNLTTALRQTSTGFLLGWLFYLPCFMLGMPPDVFVTVASANLIYQFWVHTRFVRTLGPLEYVLVTPMNHRVHHARNPEYIDKNYGGFFITPQCFAGPVETAEQVRAWREAHEQQIVDGFADLLRLPNVASDTPNIGRNADAIMALLKPRGFEVRLLETAGSPPAVFAERRTPGASKTLLIYAHYDGQPVAAEDWASDPWTPVLRDGTVESGGQIVPMQAPFDPEWRIFARSAGDDKAPIIALTAALDALAAAGIKPGVNLKLFLDGEEEAGSPHLQTLLQANREMLAADLWLFCDGPVHQSRRWQLVYGVRGAWGFDLTVYGPNRPLHSGHYGNWAPNPIVRLAELIGTMRSPTGEILIDGYGEQVVPPSLTEMAAIEAAPRVDEGMIRELGIGHPETTERLELAMMRPAINLRGIRSGSVGAQASNSIQTSATASVGLRLVPAQTLDYLRGAVERHLAQQGYLVVHEEPTAKQRAMHDRIARVDWEDGGYPSYRAPLDLPITQAVADIVNQLRDDDLIRLPTMGGSLPIYVIEQVTGAPVVILPVANHDNNQHGKDENLRLQNLWDAIEIYAAVLTNLQEA